MRFKSNLSTTPFSQLTPGDTLSAGDYEIDTGRFIAGNKNISSGFWLRSAALGTLRRAITFQDVGAVHEVVIGDSAGPALISATYIDNSVTPWRNFVPDTEVNVTATVEGILRRHSTGKVPQFVSKGSGAGGLYKSIELLWQAGTITGDGVTTAFTITFTNAQVDAAYRVTVEPDVLLTPLAWFLGGSKTNTGFTLNFPSAPALGDTYNWYALRYGT